MKYVLITGCSSGIGYATALHFAAHKWRVIATVRQQADADRLTKEFGDVVHPLVLDVTSEDMVQAAVSAVKKVVGSSGLSALINNAGIAGASLLQDQSQARFEHHFQVNVFGVHRMIRHFLPLLQTATSTIVNVSSVSGLIATPFLGAYCASKFALEAYSDSLRRELVGKPTRVVLIEPGPVKSAIWQKAKTSPLITGSKEDAGAVGFNKEIDEIEGDAMPAKQVAQLVYKVVHSRHPKSRYRITKNPIPIWLATHLLSDAILDKLLAGRMKKLARKT